MFFYFYQVKVKSLTNEYLLKAYEIINSVLYRRKDAAFIRISVPVTTDEESASQAGMKFLKDFYPIIQEFLPR